MSFHFPLSTRSPLKDCVFCLKYSMFKIFNIMNHLVFFKTKFNSSWTDIKSSILIFWMSDDCVFDRNLKSHVVYKVTFNRRSSIYVSQTSGHVTTRISDYQKKVSLRENISLNVVVQLIAFNIRF